MITLAEELREFIDSLNEYEYAPTDPESIKKSTTKFKKASHVIPNTVEGRIREQLIDFINDIASKLQYSELDEEKKKEVETKLMELVKLAQEKFQ